MPKVVVIANNLDDIPDIRKIKMSSDDVVVRFNVGTVPWDDKKGRDKNLWVFFRKNRGGAIGIRPDGKIDSKRLRKADKYLFISGGDSDTVDRIEKRNKIKLELVPGSPVSKKYDLGSTPSSGMIAVDYLMTHLPDHKIHLLGFSWKGWSGHNFAKEKKVMKDLIAKGKIVKL
jgi:hypothetical protein